MRRSHHDPAHRDGRAVRPPDPRAAPQRGDVPRALAREPVLRPPSPRRPRRRRHPDARPLPRPPGDGQPAARAGSAGRRRSPTTSARTTATRTRWPSARCASTSPSRSGRSISTSTTSPRRRSPSTSRSTPAPPAYGLRRGTMRAGHELIWDQSHMVQSGTFTGTFTHDGTTYEVDDWWGQRDHSWGIRDHARVPMWMWLAVQLPDGMAALWHWEYANGARVYTDGCFAPADGSEPIAVVDVKHDLRVDRRRRRRRQLRPRRRRRGGHRRTRRARPGESADAGARGSRTLGATVRRPRRRPQRGDRAHRRRTHGHRDLRAHRRPSLTVTSRSPAPNASPRTADPSPLSVLSASDGLRLHLKQTGRVCGRGFGGTRVR